MRNKRIVVLDDSIVRGNTIAPLIHMLREAGAKEIHMRITCPPIQYPCFMGVDMGTYDELIAHSMDVPQILEHIGADSLEYLSLERMMNAIGRKEGYCNACFTGQYPISVQLHGTKTGFEACISDVYTRQG